MNYTIEELVSRITKLNKQVKKYSVMFTLSWFELWHIFLTIVLNHVSFYPLQFPDAAGYVGFANLPNQVHRKSVKKGFEFTLMVVGEWSLFSFNIEFDTRCKIPFESRAWFSILSGESGLGKSTLINSLFLTDLYPERYIPGAAGIPPSTHTQLHGYTQICTV